MARRLVERGVRFVQVVVRRDRRRRRLGRSQRVRQEPRTDGGQDRQAGRGAARGLKSRGLLDSTLVIWGGEFGRTPTSDGNLNGGGDRLGRDHNPYGFTIWMAGGGVRGGKVIGATDEIGLRAIEDPVHVHDLHASILHCWAWIRRN